ncbi:hypothetical protein ACLOJK_037813 [Asimina triloba]
MVIDTMPTTQMQERRYLIYDLMAINSQSVVEVQPTENSDYYDYCYHDKPNDAIQCDWFDFDFIVKGGPQVERFHKFNFMELVPVTGNSLFVKRGLCTWTPIPGPPRNVGALCTGDEDQIHLPFSERWKLLEKEVIEPRNYERSYIHQSGNPHYRYDMEPFRVRRKDFWLLSTVDKLLMEFIPRLSHAADGLIFQGWDDPYVPKTHEGLLKWKYAEMNSVDFLFEFVAMKVMRSIKDNITEEVLLKEIHEIICLPMYADRTRIDKAHMRQHHANRRK